MFHKIKPLEGVEFCNYIIFIRSVNSFTQTWQLCRLMEAYAEIEIQELRKCSLISDNVISLINKSWSSSAEGEGREETRILKLTVAINWKYLLPSDQPICMTTSAVFKARDLDNWQQDESFYGTVTLGSVVTNTYNACIFS